MTTQPEIKAGQRWRSPDKAAKYYLVQVVYVDSISVLYDILLHDESLEGSERDVTPSDVFLNFYELIPGSKTRPINKDDIMKMLVVNPSIYLKHIKEDEHWYQPDRPTLWMKNNKDALSEYQFSHNPFAPNPDIVGPMVTE